MRSTLSYGACLLVLGALSLACGGGGDGDTTDLLNGTYHLLGFDAQTDVTGQVVTTWGTVTSSGAGTLAQTALRSANGIVEGPDSESGISYTIGSDRALTVIDPLDTGRTLATGRISANGSVALLGSTQDGNSPGFWLTLRRSGTFSAASLNGDHVVCSYRYAVLGDVKAADFGALDFDGVDTADGGFSFNQNGHVGGGSVTALYAVDPDGTMDLQFTPTSTVRGGILAGGQIAVLAGPTADGAISQLTVCVRLTSGATDALLSGEYFVAGLEYDLGDGEFRSSTGTVTADGSGGFTAVLTHNVEGVALGGTETSVGTYNVNPAGRLLFTTAGATLSGALSADGSFAVVGGGVAEDDNPMIYFLLR